MVLIINIDPDIPRPVPSPETGGRRIGHASQATFRRPDNEDAYSDGDLVSDSTSVPGVLHFPFCTRREGASGLVSHASLTFDEMAGAPPGPPLPPQFLLLVLADQPAGFLDNEIVVASLPQMEGLAFFIRFSSDSALVYGELGDGHTFYQTELESTKSFTCAETTRDLFGLLQVEVSNGWVPASESKFLIRLGLQMD